MNARMMAMLMRGLDSDDERDTDSDDERDLFSKGSADTTMMAMLMRDMLMRDTDSDDERDIDSDDDALSSRYSERQDALSPRSSALMFRTKSMQLCLDYLQDCDVFTGANAACSSWYVFTSSETFYKARYKSKWNGEIKVPLALDRSFSKYLSGCYIQSDSHHDSIHSECHRREWKNAYTVGTLLDCR